jgi:hypothetical protein
MGEGGIRLETEYRSGAAAEPRSSVGSAHFFAGMPTSK